MKLRLSAVLLIAVTLLNACQTYSVLANDQLRALLNGALARSAQNAEEDFIRNGVLLIDAPRDNFQYLGAVGFASTQPNRPITPQTPFLLAGLSQPITATIVYQLAEEGLLGPDGVDTTLAELGVFPNEVLDQLHRMDGVSYGEQITIHHLLTHSSGLRDLSLDSINGPIALRPGSFEQAAPDSFVGRVFLDPNLGLVEFGNCPTDGASAACDPSASPLLREWSRWDYDTWRSTPQNADAGLLNFYLSGMNEHALWAPGEAFHYSDTNYLILNLVIEHLTGNSLADEYANRIFQPLAMNSTHLIGSLSADGNEHQMAEVWAWDTPMVSNGVDLSALATGGEVVSSLADLAVFFRALTAGDLLAQENTLHAMLQTPELDGIPYASGFMHQETPSGDIYYAFGANSSWVDFYPAQDLMTIGALNDFTNASGQFALHSEIYQTVSNHGIPTPMTTRTSSPMLLAGGMAAAWLFALLAWSLTALRSRKPATKRMQRLRYLGIAAVLISTVILVLASLSLRANAFQALFGFGESVRLLGLLLGITLASSALLSLFLAFPGWRRKEGPSTERWLVALHIMLSLGIGVNMLNLWL